MKSDWIERIGYFSLLGFVAALQLSIAAANIFLAVALLMWLRPCHRGAAHRSAAVLLPARRLRDADADFCGLLGRSERQLRRLETARPVSRRADGVRVRARHESAARRPGDHHRRRIERALRHLPVRRAAVRQPRPPTAGRARPLHDLLGRVDAGDVRRGRAHSVHARSHLAVAHDARAARHPGPDVHA